MADKSYLNWPFFEPRHSELAEAAAEWAAGIDDSELGHTDVRTTCRSLVGKLGEAGWLKNVVPAEFGGVNPGLDVRSVCLLRESFAYRSGLLDFSFAMQGLGTGPISLFGTTEQKSSFLVPVSKGQAIATFALTERESGSDVAATTTSAVKDGDSYILNGEKTWISNAGLADTYVVFARTGEAGSKGLSAFIVPADSEGFEFSEDIPVTSPHPLGSIRLNNCKVSAQNLIGQPGQGMKIALATLDVYRSTVGAAAVGFARRALDEAASHIKNTERFGSALSEYQIPQSKIAEMAADIDSSALLVYRAAWAKDSGAERVTREAAMAKWMATEVSQRVIDNAVQLAGGLGVRAGSIFEQLYRDIRPLRIYEGTSEIQQLVIARQVLSDR